MVAFPDNHDGVGELIQPESTIHPAPKIKPLKLVNSSIEDARINARISIPLLFIGTLGVSGMYKFSDTFVLGPTIKYMWWGRGAKHPTFYGLEAEFSLSGQHVFTSGWLFNPFMEYYPVEKVDYDAAIDSQTGNYPKITDKHYGFGAKFTYQWMWENGINMQAGFGMLYAKDFEWGFLGNDGFIAIAGLTFGKAF